MKNLLFVFLLFVMIIGLVFNCINSVSAQEADKEEFTLEEVVVTALRQETELNKTPIAVTAVSGDELLSQGVNNTYQLADLIPNLVMTMNSNSRLDISLRGVYTSDNTEKGDPSTAFMVDGVYYARPEMQAMSFLDVKRVEVLRGPQGTLYGRNATAGVINFISESPDTERFLLKGNATYGNFSTIQANSVVNLPLSDRFALRVAVGYDRRDSYLEIAATSPYDPNYAAAHKYSVDPAIDNLQTRISGLFRFTDNLEGLLRLDYTQIKGIPAFGQADSSNFFDFSDLDNIKYRSGRSSKEYRTSYAPINSQPYNDNSTYGVSAEVNWDMALGTLTYTGSYRSYSKDQALVFMGGGPPGGAVGEFFETADYWQRSNELRLSFGQDKRLSGQAGVYDFYEKSGIVMSAGSIIFDQNPTINHNSGAFAQTTYNIRDDLHLITGLRYSRDEKSRQGWTYLVDSEGNRIPGDRNDARTASSAVTWRIGLDYDIPDLGLIYGSIATGYKAGGFDNGCVGTEAPCLMKEEWLYYEPETLISYEAGTKFDLLNGRMFLGTAAFYYDYRDFQRMICIDVDGDGQCTMVMGPPDPAGDRMVMNNAEEAKVYGLETSLNYLLTPDDRIDASLNYQVAKYIKFMAGPNMDRSGYHFDNTPTWTGSLGYRHTWTFANGSNLDINAKIRFSDEVQWVSFDGNTPRFLTQPSYHKTNVNLAYYTPEKNWNVELFVNNIEDKVTLTNASTPSPWGGPASAGLHDPRTYGVRIGYSY